MLSRLPQNPPLSAASQRQGESQLPHLHIWPGLDKPPVCIPGSRRMTAKVPFCHRSLHLCDSVSTGSFAWVFLPTMGPDGPVPYVESGAPSLYCPPGSDSVPFPSSLSKLRVNYFFRICIYGISFSNVSTFTGNADT